MKKIAKKAVLENLRYILENVTDIFMNDVSSDRKYVNEIKLVCEEVLMNIISYAYPDGEPQDMEVLYDFDSNTRDLTVKISDSGIAFDPLDAKKPDLTLDIIDRPIGGLGIFFVRQFADSVWYERLDGQNILTIKKSYREVCS